MINKLILTFILLFTLCYSALSQGTFDEGFIINSKQDTIYGFIQYDPVKTNDLVVSFKTERDADVQKIGSTEIVGFGLAQGLYFKSINISSLKEFAGFSFVEVLVQSDLSLYSISKGFILEKNNELIFLPLPSLINDIDVTKKYRLRAESELSNSRILNAVLVNGCQSIYFFEEGYKTSEKYLVKLVKTYNNCVGASYLEYKNLLPWIKLRFGLVAGLNSSKLDYYDKDIPLQIQTSNFQNVKSLFFGTEIKIYSPKSNKRLGGIIGIHYQETDYYGFSETREQLFGSYNDIFINTSILRIPVGISYQINTIKLPIILSVGVAFNNYLELDYTRIEQKWSDLPSGIIIRPVVHKNEFDQTSSAIGFWAGLGTRHRLTDKIDMGLDLRYERSDRVNLNNFNVSNFQIMFSLIY